MNHLLDYYSRQLPHKIDVLCADTRLLNNRFVENQIIDRKLLRRIYQQIHTLKGTAAAFNIGIISRLAHKLETLLEQTLSRQAVGCGEVIAALHKGLDEIQNACVKIEVPDSEQSPEFGEETRDQTLFDDGEDLFFRQHLWNSDYLRQLNDLEKKRLAALCFEGTNIYVLKADFALSKFSAQFADLRGGLERAGEIIASLPGETSDPALISLRIVFAGDAAEQSIKTLLTNFAGEILWREEIKSRVSHVCGVAFLAGRRTAAALGKKIEFHLSGGEIEITRKQFEVLEIGLLHLVTNAAAHGIENAPERLRRGKPENGLISLAVKREKDFLVITLSDDGGGINLKNSARNNDQPPRRDSGERDAKNIIFRLGFSTAETTTQYAGRGIGLNAVRDAVCESGGTLDYQTEVNRGTVFEIRLPD